MTIIFAIMVFSISMGKFFGKHNPGVNNIMEGIVDLRKILFNVSSSLISPKFLFE
jgi:hypothetical protein